MAAPASESIAAAGPNATLKPTLRTPNDPAFDAPAADDAGSQYVELGLRWCVVQRTAARSYDWAAYDACLNTYLQDGVQIRTLRIVDAPIWAVGATCLSDAQATPPGVMMCPPLSAKDDALRDFARAAAQRYGPSSSFSVDRFSFWNEPNLPKNWGERDRGGNVGDTARARRYSDRLKVFSTGVEQGSASIKVDAGEVAAGSPAGDSGARFWAKEFTDYNVEQNREGRYDALTIHPYSEEPWQIPNKAANYRALRGDHAIGVTEFGWAVRNSSGDWKCAVSQEDQRQKFNLALDQVRTASFGIHRLVWFSAIDNRKSSQVKCPDAASYDPTVVNRMNTYGLYRRPSDGSLPSFAAATPRLLRTAFLVAQTP